MQLVPGEKSTAAASIYVALYEAVKGKEDGAIVEFVVRQIRQTRGRLTLPHSLV